jgi:hypothetical protein
MTRAAHQAPVQGAALPHFLKVTRSYWSGLFHCYRIKGLPRTNNELEHVFGAYRYQERRATGRKVASAGAVVRGEVRVVAALVTRTRPVTAAELVPHNIAAWHRLRARLQKRSASRTLGRQFRRNPSLYLRCLEELVKPILPA